jgi:vancomycin aglycone glucosyltransferase
MRVLLSTIGSRGDVQPLAALAVALRSFGQDVRLCAPPDFEELIQSLGVPFFPIGPNVRQAAAKLPMTPGSLSPERLRRMAEESVTTQFETITEAARDCDAIVGATALQIAAPSIAERMGIPYVFAAYCPTVLPSPHHPPIVLRLIDEPPPPPTADNRELWAKDLRRFNERWSGVLNSHRAAIGLPPIDDVRRYVLTERPWLAADATLGAWPDPADDTVFQTGAWMLPDERPLSGELQEFLDAGDPPIYFGFGSIRAPQELSQAMVQAARALGKRAIVLRGWADLPLVDGADDCLSIGEVNQQALFKRVGAVVHHGGAGTTAAAARAGAPQVVVPQMYDQHYWAKRVQQLGIGIAHQADVPTADSMTSALGHALGPEVLVRARSIAGRVRSDGAQVAVRRLIDMIQR